MAQKLNQEQLQSRLKELKDWTLDGDFIKKDWQFKNFMEAMSFINRVAELAETHDHHPEIFNVYNKVTLRYSTHDVGGLSDRDFNIAKEIDQIDI